MSDCYRIAKTSFGARLSVCCLAGSVEQDYLALQPMEFCLEKTFTNSIDESECLFEQCERQRTISLLCNGFCHGASNPRLKQLMSDWSQGLFRTNSCRRHLHLSLGHQTHGLQTAYDGQVVREAVFLAEWNRLGRPGICGQVVSSKLTEHRIIHEIPDQRERVL